MSVAVLNGQAESPAPATSPPRLPWRKHTRLVLELLADRQFGPDHPHRPQMIRQVELYRDDLAGSSPSALEAAPCEQAAVCWLDLRCAESLSILCGNNPSRIKELEYWDRKVSRAHRRLLATLKTLAQVRRLCLVAVQINLDAQQGLRAIAERFIGPPVLDETHPAESHSP